MLACFLVVSAVRAKARSTSVVPTHKGQCKDQRKGQRKGNLCAAPYRAGRRPTPQRTRRGVLGARRTAPRRAPPHPSAHAPRCAWRAPQGSPAAILSSSAEMADESFHGPFSHGASSFGAANNLGGLISYFSSTNQCAP